MNEIRKKTDRRQSVSLAVFALSFLMLTVFLLWKCRFGFAHIDESFYLTIPYRLCRGDALFVQEWHPSQLSGFLLYPIMKVYLAVAKGTDGIVLTYRYLFTVVWTLNALFLFFRLKRFSLYGAMAASEAFMLFTWSGAMALSYNTLGVLLLLDACVVAVTAERGKKGQYFAAGLLFAGAVMCCPHLVLLYALFTLAAVLGRKKVPALPCLWFMGSLGCLTLLAVFCLFVFRRASPADVFRSLPQLLNDPEHPPVGLPDKARSYAAAFLRASPLFPAALVLTVLITLWSWFRKQAAVGFTALCVVVGVLLLSVVFNEPLISYLMIPVNLLAPYCFLHDRDTGMKKLFYGVWLPGAVYTWCINLASNTGLNTISVAIAVMSVASLVMALRFASRLRRIRPSRVLAAAVAVLVLLQIGSELWVRYATVCWEWGILNQTEFIECGPDRGVLASESAYETYARKQADMERVRDDAEITGLLALSRDPYLYLSAQKELCTYSAWLSGVNDTTLRRLDEYFQMCPEKIPDGIYIDAEYGAFAAHFTEKGYRSEQLGSGAYLLKK